jgi:predicted  nucleic acid-binding Zn ribbon protein
LEWLTDELIDRLASWTEIFGSIYKLWLHSGAYETWAFEQLARPDSWVNLEGMAVAKAISAYHPCAYYWFSYEGGKDCGEDYCRPEACPVCGTGFEPLQGKMNDFMVCRNCNIYI